LKEERKVKCFKAKSSCCTSWLSTAGTALPCFLMYLCESVYYCGLFMFWQHCVITHCWLPTNTALANVI
jgi:hypothetical protein